MNYYEHHIGDYAEATAHLTFVEDAAYSRMIRKYYAQEKPLPVDIKAVQRLIGARTKDEREAVELVLAEFFKLEEDGWHNGRCDEEVGRYLDKSEGKDAKRENERERQRRHRQRRKELFEALREHGEVPPFSTSNEDLVALLERVTSRDVTQPVTRDITANQSPVTSHQSPDFKNKGDDDATDSIREDDDRLPPRPQHGAVVDPTARSTEIATLLRAAGVAKVTAFHPDVAVTWAQNERVTDQLLASAVALAKESKGDAPIHIGYLKPIIVELLDPPEAKPAKAKSDDWAWKKSDQGIVNKGRELGMFARGGESYRDFACRIDDEIRKRKGAGKP